VADVETSFDPDLPQLPCLRDQFNQVILNLVINAAHAIEERQQRGNPARGHIRVSTRRAGDRGEIQVSDDGGGIPAKIRERIFEPFFTTKDVGRGTGQGLAITWSVIVDKHGGEVMVDSTPGEGTTFTLLLPLYPDQEDACSG
jgi:signal transduction histidine kinase